MARHTEYDSTWPLVCSVLFHQYHDNRNDSPQAAT